MKKFLVVLLFMALIGLAGYYSLCAEQVPTYQDFSIYPASALKLMAEKEDGQITIDFISDDLKQEVTQKQDHPTFQLAKAEIQKARDYLQNKAKDLGWFLVSQTKYQDGGSDLLIFAKKQIGHIAAVGVSIWHPMVIMGEGLPKNWGKISYGFSEFPVPFLYEDFPLFPTVKSLSDCKISKSPSGIEVIKVELNDYSDLEPFRFLYEHQAMYPRLYGWRRDESISFKKDYSKGAQIFFIKDKDVVKVIQDYNNKGIEFIFFTPQESKKIISSKNEQSVIK